MLEHLDVGSKGRPFLPFTPQIGELVPEWRHFGVELCSLVTESGDLLLEVYQFGSELVSKVPQRSVLGFEVVQLHLESSALGHSKVDLARAGPEPLVLTLSTFGDGLLTEGRFGIGGRKAIRNRRRR